MQAGDALRGVAGNVRGVAVSQERQPTSGSTGNGLVGRWTYRSFRNLPDPAVPCDQGATRLLFGLGMLEIEPFASGAFSGRLVFDETTVLRLTGTSSVGNPLAVRFQGIGEGPGAEGWVYDYVGYLLPTWPNGVDQRPALVGSVVRTVAHGANPAGMVASWIAVKRV
jgi:hypothetical protein